MSYAAEETYDVYREQIRKARQSHRCDACRCVIRSGDYYCAVSWVYDGSAGGVKRCGSCQLTHVHLRGMCSAEFDRDDMWPDERLGCGLEYEDEWGEEPPEEIWVLPLLGPDERGALLAPKAEP